MDSAKRERLIELGARITDLRAKVATLQSELTATETELDKLFADTTPSPNPATNGVASVAAPTPAHAYSPLSLQAGSSEVPRVPKFPELVVPPVIGSLGDQVLAVLKANPDRTLSGENLTACLNRMAGRTALAAVDSVNAALSRLTTDGLIIRVERGLYRAKPTVSINQRTELNAKIN